MRKILIILFVMSSSFFAYGKGGVSLNTTRVVINENDLSKTVKVSNSEKKNVYLVRSWVSGIDSQKEQEEWIVTPPVYKLNAEDAIQIKLSLLNGEHLPKDKESIFYLNVLTIPSTEKNIDVSTDGASGQINIALNTRVKVFYRPALISNFDMNKEFDKVFFKKLGNNKVELINPTPFHMNFQKITINSKEYKIDKQMAAPYSSVKINVSDIPNTVAYQIINDFGGLTKLKNISL
ncbi:MAG: fimbrial biogenesis chaperone [Carnobacterium maltaromaticum]